LNRNTFNAKTNGNARERKAVNDIKYVYKTRDGGETDTSTKDKENRPDELCAESAAVKKRQCISLKQPKSQEVRANENSGG